MAISGLGVAMAAAGGIVVYAGLQNKNPLTALKEIGTGNVSPVVSNSAGAASGFWNSVFDPFNTLGPAGVGLPQLVTAVRGFSGDHYSQAHRMETGYSDCSSFVGKGFKAIGIKPPGASITTDYLAWKSLVKIQEADLAPGDLVVNMAHMLVATSATTGIGQQNRRRNVQEGSIKDLMYGTGGYVCMRYVGGQTTPKSESQNAPPFSSSAGSGSSGSSAPATAEA